MISLLIVEEYLICDIDPTWLGSGGEGHILQLLCRDCSKTMKLLVSSISCYEYEMSII